ncbi:MAG: pyridoxal-dependent decarboxylase [Pseudomonadota bacterium]
MKTSDYEVWAKRAAEWGQRYLDRLPDQPVRAQTAPGEIARALPEAPPEAPEAMEAIFEDFERLVPGGLTHWQHPRFFAYFPANAAPASMIAEQLVSVMAAQCMLWQTAPVATEMETRMGEWMRTALGLPSHFASVIQDSATSATLSAVLTMRERALGWRGLEEGWSGAPRLRVYASAQTHSSVDKAIRIAGIGQNNLVKIPTDADYAMDAAALRRQIAEDRAAGLSPAGVVLCIGGTSIGASDRPAEILDVAAEEGLYSHVDAAWAGAAMICPEFRSIWEGVHRADSIVMNPHKWLGAQFDCSLQFLADPEPQVRTLGLRPDYLQTLGQDDVVNYNEWTVPLGRRFRALKLWFLMRAYGLEGLRARIRNHVAWAEELEAKFRADPDFEIVTGCRLSLFTFQYAPRGVRADGAEAVDAATRALLERINDDGRTYLTQTMHEGRFVMRVQVGPFDCARDDVLAVYDIAKDVAGGGVQ